MWKYLAVYWIVFLNKSLAKLTGNCYLEGVNNEHWQFSYRNIEVKDVEKVVFKTFIAENVTDVKVEDGSDYSKYVGVKLDQGNVVVYPKQEFENYENNEEYTSLPEINVNLNFTCTSGNGLLAFYQRIEDTNNHQPTFGKTEYVTKLPMPLPADFNISWIMKEDIIATDLDITNNKVLFSIKPDNDFVITYEGPFELGKRHKAVITTKTAISLTNTTTYFLMAEDVGNPVKIGNALLVIEVDEKTSFKPNPSFDKANYVGEYTVKNSHHQLTHEEIKLTTWDQDTNVDLEGEYLDNFKLTVNEDNAIVVSIKTNLMENILNEKFVLILTIVATLVNSEGPGKTTLVVYLPKVKPEPTVKFERLHYSVETQSWLKDTDLVQLVAIASAKEEIIYTLDSQETEIREHLHIEETTGLLKLKGRLKVGLYTCTATATGSSSGKQGQAIVSILVSSYDNPFHPVSSIMVKHIQEEREETIDIPCILDDPTDCTYEIIEQFPSTQNALFKVLPEQKIQSIAIDREMAEFRGLLIAQVTLKLKLVQAEKGKRRKRSVTDREWVNVPSDVPFTNDEIIITIIIDDINDNPPKFNISSILLGYPVKEIAIYVAPRYLAKIEATDADINENAEIIYSVDSPSFTIDPRNGEIYPTADTYRNLPTKFKFIASNKESVGTLSSSLDVEVLPLETQNLAILVVKNLLLGDAGTFLEKLSENCGYKIIHLTASITSTESTNSGYYTKIIVYGLEYSKPVKNTLLIQSIKNVDVENVITAAEWKIEVPIINSSNIRFNKDYYDFEIDSSFTGSVGVISATAEPSEDIIYSLLYKNDETMERIHINSDTAEFSIIDRLDSGHYVILVLAKSIISKSEAKVPVTLYVDGQTTALIKHLAENAESQEITLPVCGTDCVYEISNQYPATDPYLFTIKDGNTLVAGTLDRELPEIVHMLVPQFTVRLKSQKVNRTKRGADWYEWALVNNSILNKHNELTATVIVDDVNDNSPVFNNGAKLTLGYPAGDLLTNIKPQHLTIVQATDKDVGVNAKIYFSTTNDYFKIHPKTGVIYPSQNAFDDPQNLMFGVIAANTDADNPLSNYLEIEVKLLNESHLVELTVDQVLLDDVNDLLENISKETNITIKHLAASSSISSTLHSRTVNDVLFKTTLVVYALGADIQEPLPSQQLKRLFEESGLVNGVTAVEWTPSQQSCDKEKSETNEYMTVVIVLSVLLFIFIIALIAALSYFKFYKRINGETYDKNTIDALSETNKSEKHKTKPNQRRPTGFVFSNASAEDNKIGIVNSRNVSVSSEKKIEINENKPLPTSNKEQKKSVIFNENVKKINIFLEETEDVNAETSRNEATHI